MIASPIGVGEFAKKFVAIGEAIMTPYLFRPSASSSLPFESFG